MIKRRAFGSRRGIGAGHRLALASIVLAPACSGGSFEPATGAPDGSSSEEAASNPPITNRNVGGAESGLDAQDSSALTHDAATGIDSGSNPGDASPDSGLGPESSDGSVDGPGSLGVQDAAGFDGSDGSAGFDGFDGSDASDGPVCAMPSSLSCQGTCVDPTTDPLHCGSCTNRCPTPASHGVATCSARDGGGSCGIACAIGFHACVGSSCFPDLAPPSSSAVDGCLLTERFGVFVAPNGNDTTGDGSRLHPYATIGHAMDKAVGTTNRVYACGTAGVYGENLVVSTSPPRDGLHVYGGLDCTTNPALWTYDATKPATVRPVAGAVLRVSALVLGVTFEDFAFSAASGAGYPSSTYPSSIAVVVAQANNVVFTRGTIGAGNGGTGVSSLVVPYVFPSADELAGNPPGLTPGGGALPKVVHCPAGGDPTIGGKGGDIPAGDGDQGSPVLLPSTQGLGGMDSLQSIGHDGGPGLNGAIGAGARSIGALSSSAPWTWIPQAGTDGGSGGPGQGGGGGGANGFQPGAGGAAGGCGGAGGSGGTGGGASIGILAVYAVGLSLNGVTMSVGNGGPGGNGTSAQPGQSGGLHSPIPPMGPGIYPAGGNGGNGGNGGGGGGGAGGISVGILYTGPVPLLDPTTQSSFHPGQSGAGGIGGVPGLNGGVGGGPSTLLLAAP